MIIKIRILASLVLASFVVSGCSNQQEPDLMAGIMSQALAIVQGADEPASDIVQQDGFFTVSPEFVAAEKRLVVGVVLEERNSQALLTPSGQRGNLTTWLSADRASFTFVAGTMLVRTSGLGNDLQNAEFEELLSAIASGQSATTKRVHVHLTRDFQQERKVFVCGVTPVEQVEIQIADKRFSTQRFEESCENTTESFTNRYWVDAETGLIVQSVQWVHPNTGLAYFQIINS
jgi:hypothetical protein